MFLNLAKIFSLVFHDFSCMIICIDRYLRRHTGWWRRRGRSHYTIDLEKAIRLAKDEYEKEKKAETRSPTQSNTMKDDSDIRTKTGTVENTEQKLMDRGHQIQKSKVEVERAKVAAESHKHAVVSNVAPRLWSSIAISPEKAIGALTNTKDEMDSKLRDPVKHVNKDPISHPGRCEGSWRRGMRKDEKMDDSTERTNISPMDTKSTRDNKFESKRCDREMYTPPIKNDNRNRYRRGRDVNYLNPKEEASPKNRNRRSENSKRKTAESEMRERIENRPKGHRNSRNMKANDRASNFNKTSRNIEINWMSSGGTPSSKKPEKEKSKQDKPSQRDVSTICVVRISNEEPEKQPAKKVERKGKISPRDTLRKIQSPRDNMSPRGLRKGSKKGSPRDNKRISPREKRSDQCRCKPRERRNKKKRSTRRYTDTIDTPEKLQTPDTEQVKSTSADKVLNTKQQMKAVLNTEELVAIATNLVNKIVSEAMKIVKGSSHATSERKKTEEAQLEKTASVVLKHVFYIVCHNWKLYYSHIQQDEISHSKSEVQAKNDETIREEESNSVETCEVLLDNTKEIVYGSDSATNVGKHVLIAKSETDNVEEIPVQTDENDNLDKASLSSGDETLTEEIVFQVVNITTSADHLEMMSYNKAAGRKLSPVEKKSEPNVHFKESRTLRSTKSEVMTSSTNGSIKVPHGIEAQNNSEGNISRGTACRLEATQQDLPKLKVDVPTINIATNEKGSGESFEAAAQKRETATSVENQTI